MINKRLRILDTYSLVCEGNKYFKLDHWQGHRGIYVEIEKGEYDKRIKALAETISKCPDVDLLMVLTDALYDLPLRRLNKIEAMIRDEIHIAQIENRRPKINTTAKDRGTCINLAVNGKYTLNVRG